MTVCVPLVVTKGESYRLTDAKARNRPARGARSGNQNAAATAVANPVDKSPTAE